MLSALKMHKCIYFKLCALKAEYRSIGDIKHSSDFLKNIINIFVYDLFKMFVWHTECCHSLKWMLTNQTSSKAHQHFEDESVQWPRLSSLTRFGLLQRAAEGRTWEQRVKLSCLNSWPDWCTASAGPEASPTVSVCLGSFFPETLSWLL